MAKRFIKESSFYTVDPVTGYVTVKNNLGVITAEGERNSATANFVRTRLVDGRMQRAGNSVVSQILPYNSFSGCDIKAIVTMKPFPFEPDQKATVKELAELQSISYSIFREKTPVRALGTVFEKGRCLPETARVLIKDKGLISIKDVKSGDYIYSDFNTFNLVSDAWKQPETKECYRLKLREGYSLEGSFDHPVMTKTGWKEISQLVPDVDEVLVSSKVPLAKIDLDIPDWVIIMCGYLIGDGSLHVYPKKNGSKEYRISLEIADKERDTIGAEVEKILNENNIPFRDSLHKGQKSFSRIISVCKKGFAKTDWHQRKYNDLHKFLLEVGLYGTYSHTKFIPGKLFNMSSRQASLFLSRLFSTDGWFSVSGNAKHIEAGYGSTSERLIDEVRMFLSGFGIPCLKNCEEKAGTFSSTGIPYNYDTYSLRISDALSLLKFIKKIGIFAKQTRILSYVSVLKRRIKYHALTISKSEIKKKVVQILKNRGVYGKHHQKKGIKTVARYFDSRCKLTPRTLYQIANYINEPEFYVFADNLVEQLIETTEDRLYKMVSSVSSLGRKDVWDITVPANESFFANLILAKNTRGPRTIAGSMIFTIFNKAVLWDLLRMNTGDTDNEAESLGLRYVMVDQLPPFDIVIEFANEYGYASRLGIFGIDIASEGQVMSVEDLVTENVVQYTARHIQLMSDVSQGSALMDPAAEIRLIGGRGRTFADIVNSDSEAAEILARSRNSFI